MATIDTTTAAYPWRPDVQAFAPADVVPNALVLQCANVVGTVQGDQPAVRVAYIDDAAATFVGEGDTISDNPPDLSEVVVHTGKISQLVKVTDEQFSQEGTARELATSVARSIVYKADQAFISQAAPVSPAVTPPSGILNLSGTIDGGELATNLDALADLIAELQGNLANPSAIVLDPKGWSEMRKLKLGTDFSASLLGAGTDDAQPRLLGIPVIVNRHVTPYSGLVIDRNAIAAAVGQVRIANSYDRYFDSDSVAVRATWRIGWNLVRPERVGKFTIASDDGSS